MAAVVEAAGAAVAETGAAVAETGAAVAETGAAVDPSAAISAARSAADRASMPPLHIPPPAEAADTPASSPDAAAVTGKATAAGPTSAAIAAWPGADAVGAAKAGGAAGSPAGVGTATVTAAVGQATAMTSAGQATMITATTTTTCMVLTTMATRKTKRTTPITPIEKTTVPSSITYSRAVSAFRQGDYKTALRFAAHAEVEEPRDPNVHLVATLAMFALGDYRGAAIQRTPSPESANCPPGDGASTVLQQPAALYAPVADAGKLREVAPQAAMPAFLLGFLYLTGGYRDAAATELQIAQASRRAIASQPCCSAGPAVVSLKWPPSR